MLVRVDEYSVGAAKTAPERVEFLAQLRVTITPGVAGESAVAIRQRRFRRPIAECGGDDRAGAAQQRLWMTGAFWLRHRELHPGEQAPFAALDDVPLGRLVCLRTRDADRVETQLLPQPDDVSGLHARILPS